MRHKAARPSAEFWRHRLPRAAAIRIERAARRLPVRALGATTLALSLGIGASFAVAAAFDGSSTQEPESAVPRLARDAERPSLEIPSTDGRTEEAGSPEPSASRDGSSNPPSSVDAPVEFETTKPGEPTDSPSAPTSASTTSPSTADAAPRGARDGGGPNTSLSESFPEPDSARFSFDSSDATTFTCSLDGDAFSPCESPAVYEDLDSGWHTFAVRAVDADGNADPSPAETRWHARNGHAESE